jgi:hypothetical protein
MSNIQTHFVEIKVEVKEQFGVDFITDEDTPVRGPFDTYEEAQAYGIESLAREESFDGFIIIKAFMRVDSDDQPIDLVPA